MRQFRIAVIGCGGISSMHLNAYRDQPVRVKPVAACDIVPEKAQEAKAVYGFEHAFASVAETIAGAEWEVAVVCTPTPVREAVVGPLAAAGKHIFIEKPMADTIQEARRMVDLVQAAGVKMAVDQTYRYYYPFDLAKEVIAAGRIGRVISVSHRGVGFRQDAGWRPTCRRHVLSVMGVHWVDGFRWMLGAEGVEVRAQTHHSNAIDCFGETDANVQLLFDNGTSVNYTQSFSCLGVAVDTVVIGETGTLHMTYDGMRLYAGGNGHDPAETWETPHVGTNVPTTFKLLDELLVGIEQGTQPPNNCIDNLKTISLLEAAWRSAETGEVVKLVDGLVD